MKKIKQCNACGVTLIDRGRLQRCPDCWTRYEDTPIVLPVLAKEKPFKGPGINHTNGRVLRTPKKRRSKQKKK